MSNPSNLPAVFRALEGKVPDEAVHAIRLLFNGLKDSQEAIRALNTKHETVAAQVSAVSTTATAAHTTATATATAQAQPVAAGQTNPQSADYALQQQDHLGAVVLGGTTPLAISLNNLVQSPYTSHVINQSTQTATLTPLTGTVNGGASVTLAAGANIHVYFDGTNWTAA